MKDIRSVSIMSEQDKTVWNNEVPSIDFITSPDRENINTAMFQLRSLDSSTGLSIMDWTERLIELTSVSDEQTHQQIAGQPCLLNTSNLFETLEHSRQILSDETTFRPAPYSFEPGRHMVETSLAHTTSGHINLTYKDDRRHGAYSSPLQSSPKEGSPYVNVITDDTRESQLNQSSARPSCKYLGKPYLSSRGKTEQPLSESFMTDFSSHMPATNYTSHNTVTDNTPCEITQETLEALENQKDSNNVNLFPTPISLDLIMSSTTFDWGTMDVGCSKNPAEKTDTTNLSQLTPMNSISGLAPLSCSQNVTDFSDDFIDFATVEVETTEKSSDFQFKLPNVSGSGRPASLAESSEQFIYNSSLARTISSGISMPDGIEDHLAASRSDSQSPWEQFSVSIPPWETKVLSLTDEHVPVEMNSLQRRPVPSLDLKTPTDIPRDALAKNIDTSFNVTQIGSTYQPSTERPVSQETVQCLPAALSINETVSAQPYPSQQTTSSSEYSTMPHLTERQVPQQPSCIASSVSHSMHVSSAVSYKRIQPKQTFPVTLTPTSKESIVLYSGKECVLSDPGSGSGTSTSPHEPQVYPISAPRRKTNPPLGKHCLSNKIPAEKNPRLSVYQKPNPSDLCSDALLSPGDVNKAFLSSAENLISLKPRAPIIKMSSETSDVSLQDSDANSSVSTSLTEGEGSGDRVAAQNLKEKLRFRLKGKGLPAVCLKPVDEVKAIDNTATSSVPESSKMTSLSRRKRYSDVDTDSSSASRTKSFRRSSSSTLSMSSEEDHDVMSDLQNPVRADKKSKKRGGKKEVAAEDGGDEDEEEDEETRVAKREKNRLAAQKCRHMKRDKILTLSKQVYRLEERQSRIKTEVERLNEEKEQLEEMLRVHAFICKRKQPAGEHGKDQC